MSPRPILKTRLHPYSIGQCAAVYISMLRCMECERGRRHQSQSPYWEPSCKHHRSRLFGFAKVCLGFYVPSSDFKDETQSELTASLALVSTSAREGCTVTTLLVIWTVIFTCATRDSSSTVGHLAIPLRSHAGSRPISKTRAHPPSLLV